ncbi:MAG: SH3 domain-containing protein [Eubacteriales bacterium]|nr:SH3 domain-containing protein [Eubacteriales bacterium]
MSEQKKGNNFLEFIQNNKKASIAAGAAAVAVIAAAVIIGIGIGRGAQPASSGGSVQTTEQAAQASQTEESQVPEEPLQDDAVPEVNELMAKYYQAAADGDMDAVKSMVSTYDDETLIYLEKMSGHIESYQNLKCYTKSGPVDGSYVVYAYYEIKFNDLDTAVPGVSPFLIYPREDGSLYIYEGDVDESVNQYLEGVSAQDDVIDLMNRVQVVFNEAVMQDDNLNNFLAKLKEEVQTEVGEALAEAETQSQEQTETQEQAQAQESQAASGSQVKATEVVNVRASDSEQADRIGKVQAGEVLTLLEEKANGWSRVEFEGKEAYIKSEYLEPAESSGQDGQEGDASATGSSKAENDGQQEQENEGQSGQSTTSGSGLPASGTIRVAETVNVRKSASESADKIGTAFPGESLEILMQQADGWTRVSYKGQTGYVKTEVLKVLK